MKTKARKMASVIFFQFDFSQLALSLGGFSWPQFFAVGSVHSMAVAGVHIIESLCSTTLLSVFE